MCMKPIVICGPTASGKTELALFLARRLGGEIISADSRQQIPDRRNRQTRRAVAGGALFSGRNPLSLSRFFRAARSF